tara:strand:+ start:4914 stop:5462 length:549 start_codon:yes stop_codon:yes gene_type:complete
MTQQQLQAEASKVAGETYEYFDPAKIRARATDKSAKLRGEALGIAAASADQGINKMAFLQEGAESVKRDVVGMEDQMQTEGLENRMTAIASAKESVKAGQVDLTAVQNDISAKADKLSGTFGYMTDANERELKAYIKTKVSHLTPKQQYEVAGSVIDFLYDGSYEDQERQLQRDFPPGTPEQ